ncbi:helix-turn-helix domain-containing protein [Thiohalobacter thiocyanaticus]|uniref:MerR family transcriptional regulator n=1 Tax=Thiohalobacter thiocyanaticus TaxID=585455 RepID=A0A426QJT6_9GAMM|nr:MerR family transcriptional regulator [Thiohalobacter thiocyanaticus]
MSKKNNHRSTDIIDWYPVEIAARLSGLSMDMVNYLCRYGVVKPSGNTKRGRGHRRKFTFSDILLLRVISQLLSNGISVQRLRRSLAELQKQGKSTNHILKKKYLVTDGKSIYLEDEGVLELLTTGQACIRIHIGIGIC